MKPGSGCRKVPLKAAEEKEEIEEPTARVAAVKETSMDAAVPAVLWMGFSH